MVEAQWDRWGAVLLLVASLGLLAAWPAWRLHDTLPSDVYAQSPDAFALEAEAFATAYQIGERDGMVLVRPPAGADVPVIARRFEFWPALDLAVGQSYRLHVASVDTVHTVVVAGREYVLIPGQSRVIVLTASEAGPLAVQCGEYCGLGHNRMRGSVEVK